MTCARHRLLNELSEGQQPGRPGHRPAIETQGRALAAFEVWCERWQGPVGVVYGKW